MSKNAYETLMRLQRWQLDEERRRLADLYQKQDELTHASAELDAALRSEATCADGGDEANRSYPTYAARVRHDQARLAEGMGQLSGEIALKQNDVAEAYLSLKQIEMVREKQRNAAAAKAARREQERLDEIGLNVYRQRAAN